jgi:hypothetical protein
VHLRAHLKQQAEQLGCRRILSRAGVKSLVVRARALGLFLSDQIHIHCKEKLEALPEHAPPLLRAVLDVRGAEITSLSSVRNHIALSSVTLVGCT